jgi:hypothetical protein
MQIYHLFLLFFSISLHYLILFCLIKQKKTFKNTKGGNAWTSSISDFQQFLIIDLGQTRNITRVAIQGRPHHNEFVSEFSISYGYNGLDYADFKEPGGNTKVNIKILNEKERK